MNTELVSLLSDVARLPVSAIVPHDGIKQENISCVTDFIEHIWNRQNLEIAENFLHCQFKDYSQPFEAFQNLSGLKLYLTRLSRDFEHQTTIEEIVTEHDVVISKVSIHLSPRKNMPLTSPDNYVRGYRFFKMKDKKIIAHWDQLC